MRMQRTSLYCFRLALKFSSQITSSKRIFVMRRSRMKEATDRITLDKFEGGRPRVDPSSDMIGISKCN